MSAEISTPRRLALVAVALLSVFGIGVGIYMSWHHELSLYGPAGAFGEIAGCAESEGVSCDVVNTSAWSELFGVPQFTWAIPTYVTLTVLALFAAFQERKAAALVAGVGLWTVIYSLFLAYISKVELNTWCLWCIRLYVTNFLILGLGAFAAWGGGRPGNRSLGVAGGTFLVATLIAVGGQKYYRSTLLTDDVATEALPEAVAETTSRDQAGDAPVMEWTVTTEDGNQAVLRTSPQDAWKGNRDSKIAVVEFADFECGFCKRASGQLKRLYEAYGDRVVFVYKHFPMDPACNSGVNNRKHRYACMAAEASVCMQKQGLFWPFHDLAFKNQHQLRPDDLRAYAEKAGADVSAFETCMARHEGLDKVKADGAMGGELQQHGTPRIWVDGKLYRAGQSAEQMARALELALGANPQEAAARAQGIASADADTPIVPIPADVPPMRRITRADGSTFEIDTFEATLEDGKAAVGKHTIPGTRMSWFAAADACKAAGKRMCTEEEWVTACQGSPAVDDDTDGHFADDMVEGSTYPYSDYHDPRRCWDGRDGDGFRPVYTGEMPGCVSAQGVYDLTGNVEEWVGETADKAVLLGGAFDTSKDHARCYRLNDTFGAGYANARTGFRCCR
ncbi:MAG: thioredoxin domain-containing protein [Myxococcales bacterium]|nr:thioredoxin domain-containing protein [Myxococcales bacterium]